MLGATNAYCDGLKTISPNASYSDVLKSEVRADAIKTVLRRYPMGWRYVNPSKFSAELNKDAKNGITLQLVFDSCMKAVEEAPDRVCSEFVQWVVQEHNKMITISNSTNGITRDVYNKLLSYGYDCPILFIESSDLNDEQCKTVCRNNAIANMCRNTSYNYVPFTCRCNFGGSHDKEFNYIPSYEDYEKLMRTRGQE